MHVVLVVDDEWGTITGAELERLVDRGRETVEAELAYARGVDSAPAVWGEVRVGHPVAMLTDVSRTARMVALGTHKAAHGAGRASGSRGLQLAASSVSPLAVIPSVESRRRRGVVVGVGPAALFESALGFAAAEACRRGEDLILVSAGATRAAPPPVDAAVDAARELCGQRVAVSVRFSRDTAGALLASASAGASLTVVGRRDGRDGRAPLGRTVTDLLLNPGGPVVVVPERPGVVRA